MFIEKVVAFVQNENKLKQLKQNIPQQVEKYSPETAWEVIKERLLG